MAKTLARFIVTVVAAVVLVICVAYKVGPEHSSAISFLQYIPYYVFLFPAFIAFLISFKLTMRWRLLAGTALFLVPTVMMGLVIGIRDLGTEHIRVMTYNVKDYITLDNEGGFANIADEIARHDPDILILQDAGRINSRFEEVPATVRSLFGNRQVYAFGQYTVASRYPLSGCHPGEIAFREFEHTYVYCTVNTGFTQIDLYTAHFLSPREGLNAVRHERLSGIEEWEQNVADRLMQAASLAKDVRSSLRPIILAGDFNAPDSSLVVRRLVEAGVRDAFSSAGLGYGYSYGHSLRPGISFLRIDHIFVSPSIGVADCFVGGKLASPHRPVIADLLLNHQS